MLEDIPRLLQPENLFAPSISSLIEPKNPVKRLADQLDWPWKKRWTASTLKERGTEAHPTDGRTLHATA